MIAQLVADESAAPNLFSWHGRLHLATVQRWIAKLGVVVPSDLVWLWAHTGGGTMFETEQLLRPVKVDSELIDMEPVNDAVHDRGLAPSHVVFHEGLCISSWDQATQQVCTFSRRDLGPLSEVASLSVWYNRIIRPEFAARYGLCP